jgi:hypothetical protein
MALLFGGELDPLTFSIGFVRAPLSRVLETLSGWLRGQSSAVDVRSIALPLRDALLQLQPLTPLPRRHLLVPTTKDWVAYFDNRMLGPDPVPAVSYVCRQLASPGLVAVSAPHTLNVETGKERGVYGAVQFQLFAPHARAFLNYERTVAVTYDGGRWQFSADGTIQPFEDLQRYKRTRVRDRFTEDMLKTYCGALDIDISNPDFYGQPAFAVNVLDSLPHGWTGVSLAEARGKMGLASN